jgi:hypothetical protein
VFHGQNWYRQVAASCFQSSRLRKRVVETEKAIPPGLAACSPCVESGRQTCLCIFLKDNPRTNRHYAPRELRESSPREDLRDPGYPEQQIGDPMTSCNVSARRLATPRFDDSRPRGNIRQEQCESGSVAVDPHEQWHGLTVQRARRQRSSSRVSLKGRFTQTFSRLRRPHTALPAGSAGPCSGAVLLSHRWPDSMTSHCSSA